MRVNERPPPSPLGLIRQLERDISLQRATLEQESVDRRAQAEVRAAATRAEGQERGRLEAERRHQQAVDDARRRAVLAHEAAVADAAAIRRDAVPDLDAAFEAMLTVVLPPADEVA